MIFKDISDNTVRIPDDRLCGISRKDKCLLWCAGDNEDGNVILYEVSQDVFTACMAELGDKEVRI